MTSNHEGVIDATNYNFDPTFGYTLNQLLAVKTPKEPKAQWLKDMKAKLQTDEGRKKYKLRKQTVEPVFGVVKQAMGFRQFLLRGLDKVSGEWQLVTLAYNFKRLWNIKTATA